MITIDEKKLNLARQKYLTLKVKYNILKIICFVLFCLVLFQAYTMQKTEIEKQPKPIEIITAQTLEEKPLFEIIEDDVIISDYNLPPLPQVK